MNILLTILIAWLACQLIKIIISRKTTTFWQLGGMPSSHAALVGALAAAVALKDGYTSTTATITYVIAAIILHDAIHIRKQHNMTEIIIGLLIGIAIVLVLNYIA